MIKKSAHKFDVTYTIYNLLVELNNIYIYIYIAGNAVIAQFNQSC